jgi:3-dehydroquinate synthase
MKLELTAQSNSGNTAVVIEPGAISQLGNYLGNYTRVCLIADSQVLSRWQPRIEQFLPDQTHIIKFDSSESAKSIQAYENILRQLKEAGLDRSSLLISFGGGVTSDLAGFAASSYMRGIDWLAVPTSLIAQADAAIGGKTGVNLEGYKNMVGSFWPPKAVLVDPEFLKTLDEKHLRNGLAEIMKMGLIYDEKILNTISGLNPSHLVSEELFEGSKLAATAKIAIVNRDMYEEGERKLLNFGHTLGHAIEAISLQTKKPLLHGEAISIGMVGETKLAELEGLCQPELVQHVEALFTRFELPTRCILRDTALIFNKIASDKKTKASQVLWTLPVGLGRGMFNHTASSDNVAKAVDYIC